MNNISPLISAIQLTPAKLAVMKLHNTAQKVTIAPAQLGVDTSPNLFALQSLVDLQQSELTLLDPTNDASGNTNALVAEIQNVVSAYAQAQQIVQNSAIDIQV